MLIEVTQMLMELFLSASSHWPYCLVYLSAEASGAPGVPGVGAGAPYCPVSEDLLDPLLVSLQRVAVGEEVVSPRLSFETFYQALALYVASFVTFGHYHCWL